MHKAPATLSGCKIHLTKAHCLRRHPGPVVRCSRSGNQAAKPGKSTQHKQRKQQSKLTSSKSRRPACTPAQTLTAPLQIKVEAQLSKLEQAANPWWSTFCGVTNGLWLGQTAAFAPSSGVCEARLAHKHLDVAVRLSSAVTSTAPAPCLMARLLHMPWVPAKKSCLLSAQPVVL